MAFPQLSTDYFLCQAVLATCLCEGSNILSISCALKIALFFHMSSETSARRWLRAYAPPRRRPRSCAEIRNTGCDIKPFKRGPSQECGRLFERSGTLECFDAHQYGEGTSASLPNSLDTDIYFYQNRPNVTCKRAFSQEPNYVSLHNHIYCLPPKDRFILCSIDAANHLS